MTRELKSTMVSLSEAIFSLKSHVQDFKLSHSVFLEIILPSIKFWIKNFQAEAPFIEKYRI